MARVEGFSSRILGVKESQQVSLGLQHHLQSFHQRSYQHLREVVGNVPAQDRVKLVGRVIQILCEESRRIDLHAAVFLFDEIAGVLRFTQDVFVENTRTQAGKEGDVGR